MSVLVLIELFLFFRKKSLPLEQTSLLVGELPAACLLSEGYLVTFSCRQKWQPRSRTCGDLYSPQLTFDRIGAAPTTVEDLRRCT